MTQIGSLRTHAPKDGDDKDGDKDGKHKKRHCNETLEDIILEIDIFLPQSKTKEGTDLKITAENAGVMTGDLTNIRMGTIDINIIDGVISTKVSVLLLNILALEIVLTVDHIRHRLLKEKSLFYTSRMVASMAHWKITQVFQPMSCKGPLILIP